MINTIITFGIITIILVFIAAFLGIGVRKGFITTPVRWHYYLAGMALVVALIHAVLALIYFLGNK